MPSAKARCMAPLAAGPATALTATRPTPPLPGVAERGFRKGVVLHHRRREHNIVQATGSAIGGGTGNAILIYAGDSTIAGGNGNVIESGAGDSTIGGGEQNSVRSEANWGTVGGGYSMWFIRRQLTPSSAAGT